MKSIYSGIIFLLLINLLFGEIEKEINDDVEKYISKLGEGSVENLIALVINGKKDMKRAAIRKLGDLKSQKSADLLVAVMTYVWDHGRFDKNYMAGNNNIVPELDEEVRAEAALSLGKIKDPQYLALIGNTILVDKSSLVKQNCIKGLGLLRKKEGIEYIEKIIKYEVSLNINQIDNEVVGTAVKVLGDMGFKEGFFSLIGVTQNNKLKENTRREALKSLEKIKWE